MNHIFQLHLCKKFMIIGFIALCHINIFPSHWLYILLCLTPGSFIPEGGGRDSGLNEAPVEILHELLLQLMSGEDVCGVSTKLRDQFISALKREFPRERAPVVLIPLLYGEQNNLGSDQLNPTTLSLPRSVVSIQL